VSYESEVAGYLGELATRTPARSPATIGEVWDTEWKRSGLDTLSGVGRPFGEAEADLVGAIESAAGTSIENYAASQGVRLGAVVNRDTRIATLGALADTLPEEQRKAIEPLKDVRRRAAEKAEKIERDATDVAGATYGLSGVATSFLAGLTRQAVDPANVALLPLGGPLEGPLLKVVAREAAIGAGGQALQEAYIQPARAQLGLEAGFSQGALNTLQAGLGAGGLTALFRGAAAGIRTLRARGASAAAPEIRAPEPGAETATTGAPGAIETPSAAAPPRAAAPPAELTPEMTASLRTIESVLSDRDLEAAARVVERDQITVDRPAAEAKIAPDVHAERMAAAGEALEAGAPVDTIELPTEPASPSGAPLGRSEGDAAAVSASSAAAPPRRRQQGPANRPAESWSLFEFLASEGGLAPDQVYARGDLKHILDGNPNVPFFGKLLRQGGMTLDEAVQAVKEGRYAIDAQELAGGQQTFGIRELLDMIAEEARGNKQYRVDRTPAPARPTEADRVALEKHRAGLASDFDARMAELEISDIPARDRKRALQIMEREGEPDPLLAYERALLENEQRQEAIRNARLADENLGPIPGWDVVDDAGTASAHGGPPREPIPQRSGDAGTGEGAPADRGGAGTAPTIVRGVELYAPPDPLDLALAGNLTSDSARAIEERLRANSREVENRIFGSEETADKWRKLVRAKDRAWDNARDADAKRLQGEIDALERERGLTQEDEDYLDGQGWPDHSDPDAWRELARNLHDIEDSREGAVSVAAAAVRYIPKTRDWSKMTGREQESVITVLAAMNAEKAAGRDPGKFIEDVFRERLNRYGGAADADAREVTTAQMEELRALLSGPLERSAAPAATPTERTAAGEQRLIPGVEPITERQRLEAQAAAPLRGGAAAAGGLFDEAARNQLDLLDKIGANKALAQDAERALAEHGGDIEIQLEQPDGSFRKVSARQALAEAADDSRAAQELIACIGVEPE